MWQCPHCGVPQAETARCWVCRRSSTTCSTCRHFRASLASDVGYCGLDARRRPLSGLERRGCWEEGARRLPAAAPPSTDGERPYRPAPAADPRAWEPATPPRTFVPVGELTPRRGSKRPVASGDAAETAPAEGPSPDPSLLPFADAIDGWESRTSLFGEADR